VRRPVVVHRSEASHSNGLRGSSGSNSSAGE
jgi:hypothetical protein